MLGLKLEYNRQVRTVGNATSSSTSMKKAKHSSFVHPNGESPWALVLSVVNIGGLTNVLDCTQPANFYRQ